jgi:hypothetical protein
MKNLKKKMIPKDKNIYWFDGFTNYNRAENHRADAGMILRHFVKDKEDIQNEIERKNNDNK